MKGGGSVEAFREILADMGIMAWLCGLFPDVTEQDLVQQVHEDFGGVLRKLESLRGVQSREARSKERKLCKR